MTLHRVAIVIILFALADCAAHDIAVPLAPEERAAIREYHYPGGDPYATTPGHRRALDGDPAAIHAFLARSTDPDLDGGEAEIYSRDLRYLLFALGDERFSETLACQSAAVKTSVGSVLQSLWGRPGLSYPKTEGILRGKGFVGQTGRNGL